MLQINVIMLITYFIKRHVFNTMTSSVLGLKQYQEMMTVMRQTKLNIFLMAFPRCFQVYDEFDEEVLERLRQKVEALRRGKSVGDPDTVVVCPPRQENFYVLEETGYGGVYGISPNDHHYEEIGEKYKPVSPTDSLYQHSPDADGGRNVSTVDNIYESLSCFESYLEKRGDEARTSFR